MSDKAMPEQDMGYLTIEKLAEEVKPFFGQVVLMYRHEMAVLEGVGEDLNDLYYIARPLVRRPHQKTSAVWYSAVGHCEGLEPYLPKEMHDALLNNVKLNGGLPERFVMKFDTGEETLDYDPATHPALRRELQRQQYEQRLMQVQLDEDSPIEIGSLFEDD